MPTANFPTDVNLQSTLTMAAIHVKACVKKLVNKNSVLLINVYIFIIDNTKQINVILFNIFATNKRTKETQHIKPFMGNLQNLPWTAINVDVSCQKWFFQLNLLRVTF